MEKMESKSEVSLSGEKKIQFSILMCCNRDDGFLDEAVQSVLNQSRKDFEFVIVLNNCSDDLYNKVRKYKDKRILLCRTKIGQLAFNLNYGINLCNGKYIVRMDSDDVCETNRLEITEILINQNNEPDLIAGSAELIDKSGTNIGWKIIESGKSWKQSIYFKNTFIHPAMAIKREMLIAQKGYLGGFQSEDYELWLRLSRVDTIKIVTTKLPLIKYRISDTQSKGSRLSYAEVCSHLLKYLLLYPSFLNFLGFFASLGKFIVRPTKI